MKQVIGLIALLAVFSVVSAAVENKSPLPSNNSPQEQDKSTDVRKLARFEQDKKEVTSFLNAKNIVRTLVKLVFGTSEESTATSRQVLNVLVKVLDMLKTSFGQRARSTSSGRGIRDAFDDAALAGVSMMKGYVKSYIASNINDKDAKGSACVQRYMCEAARDAVRDGREMGFLVAQFGGYASTYILEGNQKASPPFNNNSYEAARRGRSGEDCSKIYAACNDTSSD